MPYNRSFPDKGSRATLHKIATYLHLGLDRTHQGLKYETGRTSEIQRISMAKKHGNPNWGKQVPHAGPVGPTSFEEVVRNLRLSPEDYEGSLALKEWVRKNKDQKYIPDDLLKSWGFEVKGDL